MLFLVVGVLFVCMGLFMWRAIENFERSRGVSIFQWAMILVVGFAVVVCVNAQFEHWRVLCEDVREGFYVDSTCYKSDPRDLIVDN